MMNQELKQKIKSLLSAKLFFILITLSIISISSSDALLQQAGSISINVISGQTQSFTWGLQSDDDTTITVQISAEGDGSEFLSFPTSLQIDPGETVFVPVDVNIPSDYTGELMLSPTIVATEYGDTESSTVINIQMAKTVIILISDAQDPKIDLTEKLEASAESKNDYQIQGQVTITEKHEEISPLQQIKLGIMPKEVLCKDTFQLLLKPSDGSPVCVTQDTFQKLVNRGWMQP